MTDYGDIALCTPVSEPYVRRSDRGAAWFLGRALRRLREASGLAAAEIDGLCVSSFTLAPDTAVGFAQHVGLSPRFLEHLPFGGACGVIALRRAARAVQAGDAAVVACLAGDTAQDGGFRDLLAGFSRFAADAVYPYGAGGPNAGFALITEAYMRASGATRDDFGKLCLAQRRNAAANPLALLRAELTMEAYLRARPIAGPLHLFDCVLPCAGAHGFLVMSAARAAARGLPFLRIAAAIERHNAFPDDPVQLRTSAAADRCALWAACGFGPEAIDLVQTYDDYPAMAMIQLEDLGFAPRFGAPELIRRHDLGWNGTFPHNTGGGQLSCGQAGAGGGYLGLIEAMEQLLGAAGARQVACARRALVSGFGMIAYDRGLCSAATVICTP